MPFVVPGQQQPQSQQRDGRGGGMERRDYASQQPGPAYRPPQQQQQPRGGGYSPWQQQRQMQYRQPQRQQYAPQGRGGYQQPQYQPPQQRGYESYGRQPQPQYQPQGNARAMATRSNRDAMSQYQNQNRDYSTRPQLGNYVGEGVYADGTPMPPMPSSGYNGQSLIQSNAGPAGGVYANFNATPDVIGGVTPRPYYEEEDTYNKPMRTGRGQGGIR